MRLPERRKRELSERFADHPLLALCRELTLPYKVQMPLLRLEPIEVFVLSANILDDLAEVPVDYYTTLQGRWLATQSLLQDYGTGADSRELLKTALARPEFQGWTLCNLDCTVFAEAPKLAPHKEAIIASLAELLSCPRERISVKAKTNEKQDAIGAGKAIAAAAIVLLEKEVIAKPS